jgi:hypothetical protein
LIAATRLATSSRNGLTTPSTMLNGTEAGSFQLLLAQLG